MIIAERKPMSEIKGFVEGRNKVILIGCRGCVTVCNTGGTKEVEVLASLLRLDAGKDGRGLTVDEFTLERQCDPEYIEEASDFMDGRYDAVLSMACPIGPQFLSERYPKERVFPILNTTFLGGALAHGIWAERCQGCGDCVIHLFGGLCPISRCAKSLLNGPCGGSSGGRCEVSKDIDCIWQQIVERIMKEGRMDDFLKMELVKNWKTGRDGGPRRMVKEELVK
jgi:ferredoxin